MLCVPNDNHVCRGFANVIGGHMSPTLCVSAVSICLPRAEFAWVVARWWWSCRVQVNRAHAPGYDDVIKQPMDLQEVLQRVERKEITTVAALRRFLCLICTNAMTYNGKVGLQGSPCRRSCRW